MFTAAGRLTSGSGFLPAAFVRAKHHCTHSACTYPTNTAMSSGFICTTVLPSSHARFATTIRSSSCAAVVFALENTLELWRVDSLNHTLTKVGDALSACGTITGLSALSTACLPHLSKHGPEVLLMLSDNGAISVLGVDIDNSRPLTILIRYPVSQPGLQAFRALSHISASADGQIVAVATFCNRLVILPLLRQLPSDLVFAVRVEQAVGDERDSIWSLTFLPSESSKSYRLLVAVTSPDSLSRIYVYDINLTSMLHMASEIIDSKVLASDEAGHISLNNGVVLESDKVRHSTAVAGLTAAAVSGIQCARLHYEFGQRVGIGQTLLAIPQNPSRFLVIEERRVALVDVNQPADLACLSSTPNPVYIPAASTSAEAFLSQEPISMDDSSNKLSRSSLYRNFESPLISSWCWSSSSTPQLIVSSETGDVFWLQLSELDSRNPHMLFHHLGLAAPTCAMVSVHSETHDMLVLPGDQGDGSVCTIDWSLAASPLSNQHSTSSALQRTQTLTSLAPMLDFDTGDAFGDNTDQIFAACGRGESGSIRIIRNGCQVEEILRSDSDVGSGVRALFALQLHNSVSLVLMSFQQSTIALSLNGSELSEVAIEVSNNAGIDKKSTTVFATTVGQSRNVLQITSSSVRVVSLQVVDNAMADVDASSEVTYSSSDLLGLWVSSDSVHITCAAFSSCQQWVAVGHGNRLRIFRLDSQGLVMPCGEHEFEYAVCAIAFLSGSDSAQNQILVGSHSATLSMLQYRNSGIELVDTLPLTSVQQSSSVSNVPESIMIVNCSSHNLLAHVGLRSGELINIELRINMQGVWTLGAISARTSLGFQPVQLVTMKNQSAVLAITNRSWFVSTSVDANENQCLPIAFETLSCAACLPTDDNTLICIVDGCVAIVRVIPSQRFSIRSIPLYQTPRRILYDQSRKLLCVICTDFCNERACSESKVLLIDPISGNQLSSISSAPHEQFLSLKLWSSTRGNLICVGTALDFSGYTLNGPGVRRESSCSGRVLLIGVGADNELQQLCEYGTNHNVYSMAPLTSELLLIAVGFDIQVAQLNLSDGDVVSLSQTYRRDLVGPILALTVPNQQPENALLFAALHSTDGCQVYRLDGMRSSLVARDLQPRMGTDLMFIDDSRLVVVDKVGGMSLLSLQPSTSSAESKYQDILQVDAAAMWGEAASRVRCGSLVQRPFEEPDCSQAMPSHTISKSVFFSTHLGGLILLRACESEIEFKALAELQRRLLLSNLPLQTPRLGSIPYPARRVIDFNTLKSFVALSRADRERLVADWPEALTIAAEHNSSAVQTEQKLVQVLRRIMGEFY